MEGDVVAPDEPWWDVILDNEKPLCATLKYNVARAMYGARRADM